MADERDKVDERGMENMNSMTDDKFYFRKFYFIILEPFERLPNHDLLFYSCSPTCPNFPP